MSQDVFISYARDEFDAANTVRLVLERNGITCWMDVEGIHGGESFGVEIPAAIEASKVVVFILSERSQQSKWTRKEITCALNAEKPVLPIAIEKCDVVAPFSFYFSDVQRGTVYQDISQSLDNLVRDVRSLMGQPEEAPVVPDDAVRALTHDDRAISRRTLVVAAGALVVGVVATGVLLPLARPDGNGMTSLLGGQGPTTATVYASDCFGYDNAGNIDSPDSLGYYARSSQGNGADVLTVGRAFSILSFVRNEADAAARVESVTFEVLELEANEQPEVRADAIFNGNTLLAYALNDGWGASDDTTFDIYFTTVDDKRRVEAADLATNADVADEVSLGPGEVARLCAIQMDQGRFATAGKREDSSDPALYLHIDRADTGEQLVSWMVGIYDGRFYIINGIGGGGGYEVTLFAVLDVDAHPDSIRFTSEEATPRVEDTYRIETVIAPTKSCHLRCKDVYSVNGQLQETPEYELDVRVRVMLDGAFGYSSPLTEELAATPDMGQMAMQQVASTYRYDPTSILDYSGMW